MICARREDSMNVIREHFASHPWHMVGCGVAGLLVIAAIASGTPILAVAGALMCGAMMIGMVWMMFAMASKGRH
jgi:FtsH-binding integral membrane protein